MQIYKSFCVLELIISAILIVKNAEICVAITFLYVIY